MAGRVLIIDDDPTQRRILEEMVKRSGLDATSLDGASKALDLLSGAQAHGIKLIILDLIMPGMDGLDFLNRFQPVRNGIPVIVQTAQGSIETVVRAMRAGAAGYVKKSGNLDELIGAIEKVHRGEQVVPAEVEAALARKRSEHPAQILSQREFQVMSYLAAGKTNREIAAILEISVKTVDTHRGHVLKKLRLRNNSDITRFAIQSTKSSTLAQRAVASLSLSSPSCRCCS